LDCFSLLAQGVVAKEGIPALLRAMAENPEIDASQAAQRAGLTGIAPSEVEKVVQDIVLRKAELVRAKGDRAIGPLMGLVMQELRGKADGALISSVLKREIARMLAE
jgi:glutamyl-tRNA(Gln) amidotransferase subunit E